MVRYSRPRRFKYILMQTRGAFLLCVRMYVYFENCIADRNREGCNLTVEDRVIDARKPCFAHNREGVASSVEFKK